MEDEELECVSYWRWRGHGDGCYDENYDLIGGETCWKVWQVAQSNKRFIPTWSYHSRSHGLAPRQTKAFRDTSRVVKGSHLLSFLIPLLVVLYLFLCHAQSDTSPPAHSSPLILIFFAFVSCRDYQLYPPSSIVKSCELYSSETTAVESKDDTHSLRRSQWQR